MVVKSIRSYVDSRRKAATKYAEEWQGILYSGIVFGATLVVMFWASVFLYTSFYFTYMPQESVTWPIHFRYNSCGENPGICSNPNAIVSVTDPNRGSLLARGQKYRVVVDIEMPESPTNQRLGMFLVDMAMKSHSGDMLRQSSRSAMLRYRSTLLQTIATTLFAPFLLYGLNEEKQMVTVELFSQYEEDPVTPLSEVHVQLQTRHIELYAAQLRIHAMFSGLRYFMYNYPLTAAAVGIGICMVFLSAVVILSWYQFSDSSSKVQVNIVQASFPNGKALAVPGGVVKSDNLPRHSISHKQNAEKYQDETAMLKNKDVDDVGIKDHSLNIKEQDLDKTKESNQLPEAERRDSDEFEVVSSTKIDGDEALKRSRRSSEDDNNENSVLRRRVQNVELDDKMDE